MDIRSVLLLIRALLKGLYTAIITADVEIKIKAFELKKTFTFAGEQRSALYPQTTRGG